MKKNNIRDTPVIVIPVRERRAGNGRGGESCL